MKWARVEGGREGGRKEGSFNMQHLEVCAELQTCETWCVTLRKDNRLGVFDNMVLEGIP
jgi:hypothetical protein